MWGEIEMNENKYYISNVKEEDEIVVHLTNFIHLWSEHLTNERIASRFKEYNPLIKINNEKMVDYVLEFLNMEQTGITRNITFNDQNFILDMLMKKNSYKISFRIILGKEPPEVFYRIITIPMLLITQGLYCHQKKLCDQLVAKDKEILEYKLEGGVITRQRVITEKFEKCSFEERCMEELGAKVKAFVEPQTVVEVPDIVELINKISCPESRRADSNEDNEIIEPLFLNPVKTQPKKIKKRVIANVGDLITVPSAGAKISENKPLVNSIKRQKNKLYI